MPQQWLVKRPQLSTPPSPLPPSDLPLATLGEATVTQGYAPDDKQTLRSIITIPVSFPGGYGNVTGLKAYYAPDPEVDTAPAATGGTGADQMGIVVSADPAQASKVIPLASYQYAAETEWPAEFDFIRFYLAIPPEDTWYRAKVVSVGKAQSNSLATAPSVEFVVPAKGPDLEGVEYAPLPLNLRFIDADTGVDLVPPYKPDQGQLSVGGAVNWWTALAWVDDKEDARYPDLQGYDVEIKGGDDIWRVTGSVSRGVETWNSDKWPIGAPDDFYFRLIPYSGLGRNTPVDHLTPVVGPMHVALETGPAGNENAPNVTNFALTNPYYSTDGKGSKALFLPFTWKKPTDPDLLLAYGGVQIHMIRGGVDTKLTGIETDEGETAIVEQIPAATESILFYALSVNKNLDPNTYQPGITPSVTLNLSPPPDSTPILTAFTASIVYTKDEFGNNKFSYTGTWNPVNKLVYKDYQGAKIYACDDSAGTNKRAISGIETGGSFQTAPTATPAATTGPIWLFAVSVDVNGTERDITTCPKVGPLFITPQGGTLTNASLPDLTTADFAANIEPVTLISATAAADGTLSIAKTTSTVFNQSDNKLYRWNASLGKYKQVGGILDINANEVTANYIAASAVVAGKIAAGAVRSQEMASNTILIGPTPGTGGASNDRPPLMQVNDVNGSLVGLFGTYAGWQGIYAVNFRAGPSFSSPVINCDNTGVTISNALFQLTTPNSNIVLSNAYFDPTYNSLAMRVWHTESTTCNVVSRGIIGYYAGGATPSAQYAMFSLVIGPTPINSAELALYSGNPPNPLRTIFLQSSTGMIQTFNSGWFQVGGNPGQSTTRLNLALAGGGSVTLQWQGGILIFVQ